MSPCKECIVLAMCKARIYIKCDLLSSFLKPLKPEENSNLLEEATRILACDIIWWSLKNGNDWIGFYRKWQGGRPLRRELQHDSCYYTGENYSG